MLTWTGTGRVCGESASSAPTRMRSSTPSSVSPLISSSVNPRQRMFGSTPCTSTMSRESPVADARARESRVVGQTSRSVFPATTSITGRLT